MYILYLLCSLLWICVNSSIFDQRQSGDLNVQVDLKGVRIFALMKGNKEEYVDYDYAYDYSELTIKPQNRTTPKPFSNTSSSTVEISTSDSSTFSTTSLQENITVSEDYVSVTPYSNYKTTNEYSFERNSTANFQNNVTIKPTPNTTIKNCKRGFILNQKGDCQLKLNSTGNALMKLVKLSQKLKLRRENKSSDNS